MNIQELKICRGIKTIDIKIDLKTGCIRCFLTNKETYAILVTQETSPRYGKWSLVCRSGVIDKGDKYYTFEELICVFAEILLGIH